MSYSSRRTFLQTLTAALAAGGAGCGPKPPPVRTITRGPKFHWFGYYDRLQFDPASRYALGMEVDFEHRSPRPDDVVRVGMVDTQDGDRWTELGTSRAWNWQQGCSLQWVPGSKTEVIWNDRQDNQFVCHVLDVVSGKKRTLPAPVYALAPDGRWAVTTDFARLNDTRPGYGYGGAPDPNAEVLAPDNTGIWRIDLTTGNQELIITLADAVAIPSTLGDWAGAKHWFNHLLVSPDGSRFIFLHRWAGMGQDRRRVTRLFTANPDGTDLYALDPDGRTSHFIWRDPKTVLAWAWHPSHGSKFYLHYDQTGEVEAVGPEVMTRDGHCSYLPGNEWILNDTYPDKQRNQNVYLYKVATGERVSLGYFHLAPEYTGEWRCDTHPRFSPDGRKVCIDSPHRGNGRQMHLIDIREIAG